MDARLTSSGFWSPEGQKMADCDVVFLGDSMFRRLSAHMPARVGRLVPGICLLAGRRIAEVSDYLDATVSKQTKLVVLMFGTNDIDVSAYLPHMLERYEELLAEISHRSPQCQIFICGLVHRAVTLQRDAHDERFHSERFVQDFNVVITKFNAHLKQLCAENASLHYLSLSEGSEDKCKLLANDGLHFNYRGISITAQSIVNQIELFTSTPNSTFSFHPTSHLTSLPPLDDQSHFPELGLPKRKPGTISPYTPELFPNVLLKSIPPQM